MNNERIWKQRKEEGLQNVGRVQKLVIWSCIMLMSIRGFDVCHVSRGVVVTIEPWLLVASVALKVCGPAIITEAIC